MTQLNWSHEGWAREGGYQWICGCDEAGAGPLAGPVYGAAVILPYGLELEGLQDSKKVSPRRREQLFAAIQQCALAYGVAWVDPEEIDQTDILSARLKAMQLAMDQISPKPDYALIDGNRDHGRSFAIQIPHETVVRGDGISPSIAAASILAKVSRDRWMEQMAEQYPGYGFQRHKGYGTAEHRAALERYGPCPIHRQSFLRRRGGG